jgi:hypothetical protein
MTAVPAAALLQHFSGLLIQAVERKFTRNELRITAFGSKFSSIRLKSPIFELIF